ncbi:hypothetical protein [Frateuria aurantia]|uniref:Uncharacterized protein n=1 Tax=Frateuria aurantia (strain ATCC 33424 / DSM 6220 / KCTC 2777 / LMG 1558 / NBRC 3245 / NCIMB 13370) TaxID=767434 RepID=H8L5L7_FRAAD|nr:hypothetical protein [Frateuria aurantia]AFC86671.1 hypothetical protein Fraau_2303 [Frateuria aurantia DSM 6220]
MRTFTAGDARAVPAARSFPVCALALLFIGVTFVSESSPVMRGVGMVFLLGLALDTARMVARGTFSGRA